MSPRVVVGLLLGRTPLAFVGSMVLNFGSFAGAATLEVGPGRDAKASSRASGRFVVKMKRISASFFQKPQSVLETPDGLFFADIDLLVLRWHRHGRVVLTRDDAVWQRCPLMRAFLADPAEVSDRRVGREKPIYRPLQIGADSKWEFPFGDRDAIERDWTKMLLDQRGNLRMEPLAIHQHLGQTVSADGNKRG